MKLLPWLPTSLLAVIGVATGWGQTALPEAKLVDLKDGFVRVTTPSYVIEVPRGWVVGAETPFGQREFEKGEEKMSVMTARGAGAQGWDKLYQTSLFFISRSMPGTKPTPYKLGKTNRGVETCSFSMLDSSGFASARYVILKAANNNILALSVKIPGKQSANNLTKAFARMVESARFVG